MMENYILFVAQDCCFQTRSMLIPEKEYIEAKNEDYQLLKKCSYKNVKICIKGHNYTIENLLIQNFVRNGNIGVSTIHPYTKIIGELSSYADGRSWYDEETNKEEKCYFDLNDKEWYDKAITNLTSGFNHFKNYHKLRQLNL